MALELPELGTTKVEAKPRAMPSLVLRFDKIDKFGKRGQRRRVMFVLKNVFPRLFPLSHMICHCSYEGTITIWSFISRFGLK